MHAQSFGAIFHKISRDLREHMETELAPAITEGQLAVLELLQPDQQMKPSDFLPYLSTTPAAVTTLLDRMEKSGLIERNRDEKDRRVVWVTATEKGKAECIRGVEVRQQFLRAYLSRISSHNQQLLVYLLGKVADIKTVG